METFFQDLRHSLRMFRQNPAFSFAAIAALALGIGANTAIFSVVNTVLLSPLEVYEPDRLITFRTNTPTSQNALGSPAKFAYWKGLTDVIELISASRTRVMNYTGGDEPEQVTFSRVSKDYFQLYGAQVMLGRTFTAEEDTPNGPQSVVVSHSFWERRFNSDPSILGRTLLLRGVPHVAVGVMDPGFPDAANALNLGLSPIAWVVRTKGSPAALIERIQTELRQASGLPLARVTPMEEIVSNSLSRQKFNMWLMTVFGFTALLLASIGIYGLMAYSVQQRTQEIGIRLALGARLDQVRNMVVRQGMLLAGVGVAIGLGAAFGLAQFISTFLYGVEAHDPLTFVAVPVLLALTALAAIWIPARRASRVEPLKALRYE